MHVHGKLGGVDVFLALLYIMIEVAHSLLLWSPCRAFTSQVNALYSLRRGACSMIDDASTGHSLR